jgi:uncharacterized repeat protein (TIGR03803 family)
LYGVANYGAACGVPGCGTVFHLDITAGKESVLHRFTGQPSDGANPAAGLIRDSAGNFYGTTESGATGNMGTVFEVTAAGDETVLYSFRSGAKGGPRYPALLETRPAISTAPPATSALMAPVTNTEPCSSSTRLET